MAHDTVMNVKRETYIPADRFWQEIFLRCIGNKLTIEDAKTEADEGVKLFQQRRSENQRRREQFVP